MTRFSLLSGLLLLSLTANATLLRDRIGVAHAGGKYSVGPTDVDYLAEGAARIRTELGSRVIKLWLTRRPAGMYPFHSPRWLETRFENDLAGIADHPYFKQVFSMPFTTIILVVDSRDDVWFGDGVTAIEGAKEEAALHDLTRYLIQTYAGSGKTFILQNWEGDWLLRLGALAGEPSPTAVEGMARWLNARQRGVERARTELAHIDGVTVKHAVEVNHVIAAKYHPPGVTVTNDVLPHVQADMYSYSAWEAGDATGALLREMLTYLDEKTPGSGNIYVGEYGAPENVLGSAEHLTRVTAMTNAALDWGAAYVVYWQLYCNELTGPAASSLPHPILNSDMRGFWLVRPDGTRSAAWYFLRNLIRQDVRKFERPQLPRWF